MGSDDGELDFPSRTEAYHDKDGMFKMKESEPGRLDGDKMVQLDSGIFAPVPKWKTFRMLWIDTQNGHFSIECDESIEEIQAILDSAKTGAQEWYEFTDPAFGHKITVPFLVLQHPICIAIQFKDIEAIEEQNKAYELQKRMAKLQAKGVGASVQQVKEILRRN